MAKKGTQNIYETATSHARGEKLWTDRPVDGAHWLKEERRTRMKSWIFFSVLAIFGVLVSIIAVQYYLLSETLPKREGPDFREDAAALPYRLLSNKNPQEMTPREILVLDEYLDMDTGELPAEGPAPLTSHWVKQAGYYITKAEKAYQSDNPEEALEMYDRVIMIFPTIGGIHHYRGLCYLQMGDAEVAAEAFAMASEQESMAYGLENNLGVSYMTLKEYDKAEEHFLRAVEKKPDYALALLNLGTLYLRTGAPEKAEEYYKKYLKYKPGDLQASQAYASLLMDQQKWEDAIPVLVNIHRETPELAPTYFQLGEALAETGNFEGAIQVLEKGALFMDPRKALALLADPGFDKLRSRAEFRQLIQDLSVPDD